MKKVLHLYFLLFSIVCFSQAITVNTTTYTVPQLVSNVLINSPCVSATNVSWKTGTNFGSSNGIGYFQNTNPNFPMQSGVILSTGSANNAVGPNNSELNDGAINWSGDNDLERVLSRYGIPMTSSNATVLEFDFMPISSTFSFDFLFASEEYGNFQCQFSDAFAFLLTNKTTGTTTNLAIVPNTSDPISVVTIRDFLYNSSCPSVNSSFFGTYNGGSATAGSATNFNGQTKSINVSAILIPNTPYHIKLVIADRTDPGADSAIFISSDSFNISQDVLGQDLTVANNNAVCFGESYTINSDLNPALYSFSWKKDGVVIPGAIGASINISLPGIYQLTYQNTVDSCQPITDAVKVEYFPKITTSNPISLYKCNSGAATYTYNLSINTPIVKTGLNPLTVVTYYSSLADATNGINSLPTNYDSASGQTVYVRIKSHNTPCFVIKSFTLMVAAGPIANQPQDMTLCARSATLNNAIFNFSLQNGAVLNGQLPAMNQVSYYASLLNATNATSPLSTTSYTGTNNAVIYVRVQNASDTSCFSITNFTLIVKPLPLVDVMPNSIKVCNSYTLPALTNGNYFTGANGTGTALFAGAIINTSKTIYIYNSPNGSAGCAAQSSFVVTIVTAANLAPASGSYCGSRNLAALVAGNYYSGPGGTGTLLATGTTITTTKTIYVYFKATIAPFCELNASFVVTIVPIVNLGSRPDVFGCSSYILPPLANGNYFTATNGGGVQIAPGSAITTSKTIYVFYNSGTPSNCKSEDSFNVYIGLVAPADITQCTAYTLPALPIGNYFSDPNGVGDIIPAGTVISEPKTIYIFIANSDVPNCTDSVHFNVNITQPQVDILSNQTVCESYTLPELTYGAYYTAANGGGTVLNAGAVITSTKTIYIYKRFTTACYSQSSFVVTVNPNPLIDSRSHIDICNFYELTALTHGNYYTGPGGTGTMLPAGTIIRNSQIIYIYAVNNSVPPCSVENSFDIVIYPVVADDPADVIACDSFTLTPLTVGNYYTLAGGPSVNGTVLMHAGDIITASTKLYVYTESGERINCIDDNEFTITIYRTPVVDTINDVNVCNSYVLPALTVGNYFTATGGAGTMLLEADEIKTSQTIYIFAQSGSNCFDEKSFEVTVFNVDELPNITKCSYVLPAINIGAYYTASMGTGTLLHAGQEISSSQTLYIYAVSPFDATCHDEWSFMVTILESPIASPVPNTLTTVCDDDGTNDGITLFQLNQLDAALLGTQPASGFAVHYFASQAEAIADINSLIATNLQTVFAKVSNILTGCYVVVSLQITVLKVPEPNSIGGIICIDSKTGSLLNPFTINSGLSASTHTFEWFNDAGTLLSTASSYQAVLVGTYTLIATNNVTGCASKPTPIVVSPSEPADVSFTISDDFSDNQIITVIATGVGGDYEYQLDTDSFQDSPIFQNVSSGIHLITVRDKNGCGIATTQALAVNYPKFFTPNNDGYNDEWNIVDLDGNAKIYIFDRFGSLLKEIKPNGDGWDGSFNGQSMPTSDYWFSVNYQEQGTEKVYRSHFTLKR